MNLNNLKNKKIAILGLGIENFSLVNFLLSKKIPANLTICDSRSKSQLGGRYKKLENSPGLARDKKNLSWRLGKRYDDKLKEFDVIFRSPGYPLFNKNIVKAKKSGSIVSSPLGLFFALCPAKNIIGVTGTKGKGTTASLIYSILKTAGKKVFLGGNIGVAPFDFINKVKKNNWVILELSSFQLEDMAKGLKIAVITNLTKEHLAAADPNNPNYHKSMNSYWKAKLNIIKHQKKEDMAVINNNLKQKIKNLKLLSKIHYFNKSNIKSKLAGEYHKENIAAAVKVCQLIGIKDKIIKEAVNKFKGLEHRLELVKTINNVKYYNNSFATTPESTILDLQTFSQPINLIVGGADKGANFKQLAREIKKKVKFTVLLDGKGTGKIKNELRKISYPPSKTKLVKSMRDAVRTASDNSPKGDIVLLSPACASFGMFKNYKDRGEQFKKYVKLM